MAERRFWLWVVSLVIIFGGASAGITALEAYLIEAGMNVTLEMTIVISSLLLLVVTSIWWAWTGATDVSDAVYVRFKWVVWTLVFVFMVFVGYIFGLPWLQGHPVFDAGDPTLVPTFEFFTLFGMMTGGALLYCLKRQFGIWYGVLELTVAVAANWILMREFSRTSVSYSLSVQQCVVLGATLYLFSRAVGNIIEGLEKRFDAQRGIKQ
jgi:hypothetical protein